jgi:hypothetical protein
MKRTAMTMQLFKQMKPLWFQAIEISRGKDSLWQI